MGDTEAVGYGETTSLLERLKGVANGLMTAKGTIAAVMFIAAVSSAGTVLLAELYHTPTNLREVTAAVDTLRDQQVDLSGRMARLENSHTETLRALHDLTDSVSALKGTADGLECVVLLERPPRTCISRRNR